MWLFENERLERVLSMLHFNPNPSFSFLARNFCTSNSSAAGDVTKLCPDREGHIEHRDVHPNLLARHNEFVSPVSRLPKAVAKVRDRSQHHYY